MAEISPEAYNVAEKWIQPLQLCDHWEAQHFFNDYGSEWNLEICRGPLKTSWIPKGKCLEWFSEASVKATDSTIACSE